MVSRLSWRGGRVVNVENGEDGLVGWSVGRVVDDDDSLADEHGFGAMGFLYGNWAIL
jgi:hypothetical protein